jgi:hypothetical protein
VLGQLVDAAGAVDVGAAQCLGQRSAVEDAAHGVERGVAEVGGDGLPTVRLDDTGKAAFDFPERLIPAGLAPLVAGPDHRTTEPVRILVQSSEACALGTDVSPRERIVLVPSDGQHLSAVIEGQAQSTYGIADRAGAVGGSHLGSRIVRPGQGLRHRARPLVAHVSRLLCERRPVVEVLANSGRILRTRTQPAGHATVRGCCSGPWPAGVAHRQLVRASRCGRPCANPHALLPHCPSLKLPS